MLLRSVIALSLICECSVASVPSWILKRIQRDNDYFLENSFECSESRFFVPFFLKVSSDPALQKGSDGLFGEGGISYDPKFVPGGYIFRLKFPEASLFSLSGGWWGEGNGSWYSPEMDNEIEADYDDVWRADPTEDYSYASFLAGIPPRSGDLLSGWKSRRAVRV